MTAPTETRMLVAPLMRGRDKEFAVLDEAMDDLAEGRGSVVVVKGAPGFGKSRLLDEVVRRCVRRGLRGGIGMADPLDRVVELAPLMEALFDGNPPLLDRGALRDAHAAPEQRFWLLQDLEALLEQAALSAPLFICLDDLQWADNGTAAALRSLPRRLATLPILWLVSTRPGQGSNQVLTAIRDLEETGARHVHLGPLPDDAVVGIVTDILEGEPDEKVLGLVRRTKGNPFLLIELLRGFAEEGMVRVEGVRLTLTESRLPRRVSDDMRERLSRLPEAAERVALVAASLGRRVSATQLAEMADVSLTELMPTVRVLTDAAILVESEDRLSFGHDLVRDAVRSSVSSTVRRALDRRGVDVLLDRGALPVEVAAQLADSAELGDHAAVRTLFEAAEALGATDPVTSAELAERALSLAHPEDDLRGRLVARRAVSLFAAGMGAEAKRFADTALQEALPPEQQARVRLTIASMFTISPEVRAENARQALSLPGLSADLRAWLEALVLHNLVVAGRTTAAAEVLDRVRSTVSAQAGVEGRFALELACAGYEYQLYGFESSLKHLDAGVRYPTSEDVRARLAQFFRSWPLAALDRFDEALAAAEEGARAAQRDRQNWALHIFETWKGLQSLHTGRLADAALMLEGRFSPKDKGKFVGIIDAAGVSALGRLRLHLGDERGVRDVSEICAAMLQTRSPAVRRQAAWFLACRALAQSDVATAHQMVCALGEQERLVLFPLFPHEVSDDPRLVRLALAADDEELGRQVNDAAECRRRRNPTVASVRAAAAHVRGLVLDCASDLGEAVVLFGESGRPLAQASALEDLGRAHRDRGARAATVEAFDQALALTVSAGAVLDSARLRQRLRELGVRRRVLPAQTSSTGWRSLTPAETAVADLAVVGRTNREIAQQLFISPHTVNAHLRHIFEKTGVRSRVELVLVASEGDD